MLFLVSLFLIVGPWFGSYGSPGRLRESLCRFNLAAVTGDIRAFKSRDQPAARMSTSSKWLTVQTLRCLVRCAAHAHYNYKAKIMERKLKPKIPEVPTAFCRCKRCRELWRLEELNLASGAGKDGYYCFQCTEALQLDVEPNCIDFRPALDTPAAMEFEKWRL